jgi:hypothetical protein
MVGELYMNFSKLLPTVGLASMLAIASLFASLKPKEAAAKSLAQEDPITFVNRQETADGFLSPFANEPITADIDRVIVWAENPAEIEDNSGQKIPATAEQSAAVPQVDSKYIRQSPDSFNVVKPAVPQAAVEQQQEQPNNFGIRIKNPDEIFRSLIFYVAIAVVILLVGIFFLFEVLKVLLWIILLPLKVLISFFR